MVQDSLRMFFVLFFLRTAFAIPSANIRTRATAATNAAIGPSGDLHIINGNVSPDGFQRAAVLASSDGNANGAIGPLVKANKGETFQINVINALNDKTFLESTSIHWHGLVQSRSNFMEGVAFVTQCPIAHGNSFLYQFATGSQAGTFWYHSHLSTQYCDGLRGPLVVYDPADPQKDLYDVDDESTIISLSDWYHTSARSLAGKIPASEATLINGLGRSFSNPTSDLAVINVEAGKRYRFRLINMACDPAYTFSIDNHAFSIIEADGVAHKPVQADQVQIFAGQRYSLVMNADQPAGNYWIRAKPNSGSNNGFAKGINSAILRYKGAPVAEPTTSQTGSNLLKEQSLQPLENPGAPGQPTPGGVDQALNLVLGFKGGKFQVNGVTFTPPTVPVLLQILSGAKAPQSLLPSDSVFPLPLNSNIELSIPGGVAGSPHPFHLHGHTFDVVRSAGSSQYNYANPPRRDVVNTGVNGDNVTVRFRTDNAGPWFLHCHIDWHLELGLAIVFAEDAPSWKSELTPPSAWDQLCPIYDALPASDI